MADSMSVDARELRSMARKLGNSAAEALVETRAVVAKSGVVMKAQMRSEASGGTRRFSGIAPSIGFDLYGAGLGVEVGPEIGRRQGSLAHIAYFGSSGSGPQYPDPVGVLEREAPVAERFLAEAVERLL